jgi:hypothetical protein
MAAISGNSGNVTGPTGLVGVLNTWSANVSRAVSDVTGFTNVGRNRILGVYDLTGSAGGILDDGTNFDNGSNELAVQTVTTGTTITLTAKTGCTIGANVVFSDIALGSSKSGDATVTFTFSLASTATTGSPFTISWAP